MKADEAAFNDLQKKLTACCLRYQVTRLFVFGSFLRQDFSYKSDVDFLVEYGQTTPDERKHNNTWLRFWLAKICKRKIHLVEQPAVPTYFSSVANQTKRLIFDRSDFDTTAVREW